MSKHLVDIDEQALSAARSELGTRTIKETVNRALRQAVEDRDERVKKAFDVLASSDLAGRQHVEGLLDPLIPILHGLAQCSIHGLLDRASTELRPRRAQSLLIDVNQ